MFNCYSLIIDHTSKSLRSFSNNNYSTFNLNLFKGNVTFINQRFPIRINTNNFCTIGNLHSSSIKFDPSHQEELSLTKVSTRSKVTIYKTRESIEKILLTDQFNSLIKSGWIIKELNYYLQSNNHHKSSSSSSSSSSKILVLQKNYLNQFKTWDQILTWLKDEVSPISNELNHHPDIAIKNFNHLELTLFTHSLKALTLRDFKLALRLNQREPKLI